MSRIIPSERQPLAEDLGPSGRGEADSGEWYAEKAAEALRWLAERYPECAGSEKLHPHQDVAHEAAIAGDREAYLEALRAFVRTGKAAALRKRREAA